MSRPSCTQMTMDSALHVVLLLVHIEKNLEETHTFDSHEHATEEHSEGQQLVSALSQL